MGPVAMRLGFSRPQASEDATVSSSRAVDEETDAHPNPDKQTLASLFTITMFGSLDDFAVFVSVMLSGVLSVVQLMIGVLLGCCIVLVVCKGAGSVGCVSRVLEKIPLWSIIGCFAVWTFVSCFALQ